MVYRVIVLGAGISGLATSWYLKQRFKNEIEITLVEKSSRFGGWIETHTQNGFLFEQGPRGCRVAGKGCHTLDLIEKLGLKDSFLSASPAAKKRYLCYRDRIIPFPEWYRFPFSPLANGWMRALYHDLTAPKATDQEETIHSFFKRRIGIEWTERFIAPMISGIYAGDITELSMKSCLNTLWQLEHQSRSLLKGSLTRTKSTHLEESAFVRSHKKCKLFSFQLGMETLPRALFTQLEAEIHLNAAPSSLEFYQDQVAVVLEGGKTLDADFLISTLPSSQIGMLLHPLNEMIGKNLTQIPQASMKVINLGYHNLKIEYEGFGYLMPPKENQPILGCLWDSLIFPQQNTSSTHARMTVMMGGTLHPKTVTSTDENCLGDVLAHLDAYMGIKKSPDEIHIKSAFNAIPQYTLKHAEVVASTESFSQQNKRIAILGNSFYGVGVNDCIYQAKKFAQEFTK